MTWTMNIWMMSSPMYNTSRSSLDEKLRWGVGGGVAERAEAAIEVIN